MMMKSFDIVVMGGGMTGLAAALFAAMQGFRVAVIEKSSLRAQYHQYSPQKGAYAPRVSAITPCSQTFLEHIGAWPHIAKQRCAPYQAMSVWDSLGYGCIDFNAAEAGEAVLGHIIENDVIVKGLLTALELKRECFDITLYDDCCAEALNIQEDHVSLTLNSGECLQSVVIIGADGVHSWVREQLVWPVSTRDYQQSALVTTVVTEKSHQRTAWQRFLPTGPLAFLPLDDEYYSSIVWSLDQDQIERVLNLTDSAFKQELMHAFSGRLGQINEVAKRFAFPLSAAHACGYARPRVALVGDAAHRIHPLAGQGVNLGFLDVMSLVDVLVTARQKKRDIGHMMTLQKYERARYGDNLLTSAVMTGFKELFATRAAPIVWLRTLGLKYADQTDFIKCQLIKRALGRQVTLPQVLQPVLEGV
ncbi:UbiH/UbiF/VisC/COQ6 family ubiquinone biosynthesis hydroxylase [Piscirickettsia salmonis]|uniref:UbiH/UbiF/VisC/COQ6 family ubiquinone biosynthesis hydroxylase n=1 Tax=Piscirickettsia salmonis TaxID=1238 RepID=UPI0007C8A78A